VRFGRALDLGCGTGLMARALRDLCGGIRGVDLSPRMAALARATGLYEEALAGDLVAYLEAQPEGGAELVVAADVFVYLARLEPALAAAARALEPGGLLAFSVQDASGDEPVLGDDARFAHPPSYLRRAAREAGFAPALIEAASTRQDRGAPVPGLVAVLERTC
jgi:predicted TPR repeat methyltransferase